MTRTLTAAMKTAAAAVTGEIFHLFDFAFSGGTLYLTDAPNEITFDGNIYSPVGRSGFAIVARGDFNAVTAPATQINNYSDVGFGRFNLGSGAGAGMKPFIVGPLWSPEAGQGTDFTAPHTIKQTGSVPDNFVVLGFRASTIERPFPDLGFIKVNSQEEPGMNGVYEIQSVTGQVIVVAQTLVTASSTDGVCQGSGRAANQILVGGPEINVGDIDVANDNFKLWCWVKRPAPTPFQAGMVCRSNHSTTNDTNVDHFRLYVNANGDSNVDVVLQKRINNLVLT